MKNIVSILPFLFLLLCCNSRKDITEPIPATVPEKHPEVVCDTQPADTPIIKDAKKTLAVWLEDSSLDWFLKYRQTAWREAKAWSKKTIAVDSSSLLQCLCAKEKNVFLYIPRKHNYEEYNEYRYIRFYIVNNTADTISIPRIDAVIDHISASVSFSEPAASAPDWKLYQQTSNIVECGNSFWTQKLPPGTAIEAKMENEYMNLGSEMANYRIELTLGNKKLVSNTIKTGFMKKQLGYLGTTVE